MKDCEEHSASAWRQWLAGVFFFFFFTSRFLRKQPRAVPIRVAHNMHVLSPHTLYLHIHLLPLEEMLHFLSQCPQCWSYRSSSQTGVHCCLSKAKVFSVCSYTLFWLKQSHGQKAVHTLSVHAPFFFWPFCSVSLLRNVDLTQRDMLPGQ